MRGFSMVLAVGLIGGLSIASAQAAALKVGDKAPDFKAKTVTGKTVSLADAKGADVVVICFTCNTCPVARAYEQRFIDFVKKYSKKGVKFIALDVNRTDSLATMKEHADEHDFNFPYAYDGSGASAEAYGAKVTPHMFVVNRNGVVSYIGAFDDNMNAKKVKKHYVIDAVNAILSGQKPPVAETRAFGCGIKR